MSYFRSSRPRKFLVWILHRNRRIQELTIKDFLVNKRLQEAFLESMDQTKKKEVVSEEMTSLKKNTLNFLEKVCQNSMPYLILFFIVVLLTPF